MVIKPKIRGFICTNSHPVGCAEHVRSQISYVQGHSGFDKPLKNVLVLGCSTGYGLASRIVSAFGYGANTLGVCFEKAPTAKRTATAGYYNTAAFHQQAKAAGMYAKTINGDAFSEQVKQETVNLIKQDLGKIDLIVYSLAAPRRTDPTTGVTYKSVLKPIGTAVTSKNYDTNKDLIHDISLEPATDEEISDTVKVMGGEDWEMWIAALHSAGLLAEGCKTTAYTYIGKQLTQPVYGSATIGKAKDDLDRAAADLTERFRDVQLTARISSLKALVTQSSSAIPVMPLYISLVYQVMKEEGTHEGCIEQIAGLFSEKLLADQPPVDEFNRLRMDGKETNYTTQAKIQAVWDKVSQDNFHQLSDYAGYHSDFLQLFGFGFDTVDYDADVSPLVDW